MKEKLIRHSYVCIHKGSESVANVIESINLAGEKTHQEDRFACAQAWCILWHNILTVKASELKLLIQHCCELFNNTLCSVTKLGCFFIRNFYFSITTHLP